MSGKCFCVHNQVGMTRLLHHSHGSAKILTGQLLITKPRILLRCLISIINTVANVVDGKLILLSQHMKPVHFLPASNLCVFLEPHQQRTHLHMTVSLLERGPHCVTPFFPTLTRMRSKLTGPWARPSATWPSHSLHCLTECPYLFSHGSTVDGHRWHKAKARVFQGGAEPGEGLPQSSKDAGRDIEV